jgi:hypothetical protein
MLLAVLDYLDTRPEVDKTRIAMHGVSWDAYRGTKMAILEKARLRAPRGETPRGDSSARNDAGPRKMCEKPTFDCLLVGHSAGLQLARFRPN